MDHSHKRFHEMLAKRAPAPELTTVNGVVMSVVYVTADPTFSGEIGGYVTLDGEDGQDSATAGSDNGVFTLGPPTSIDPRTTQASAVSSPTGGVSASASDNDAFASSDFDLSTTLRTSAVTSNRSSNTAVAGAATTSSSADSATSSSSDGGMSTGAKAGLAIGIIAVVGIIAALLLWFLGKKKREREAYEKADDEKSTFGATSKDNNAFGMTQTPTSTAAPRLSLRPMSSMMPGFMGGSNRRSAGNMLNTISENGAGHGAARNLTPSPQPRNHSPLAQPQRAPLENPFADPQNPFADPEKPSAPASAPVRAAAPQNDRFTPTQVPSPAAPATRIAPVERKPAPFNAPSPATTAPPSSPAPLAAGTTAAATAGTIAAGVAAARSKPGTPKRQESPREQPHEFAPSPAPSTPSSVPAPVAAAAAVPPSPGPESPAGNVYRVLMDFVPSMEDELELKTGQLVRCLHEYDDGWALCIKLDRSQQGVVPRTCLAAKPSKPKPSHLNQYARGPGGVNSGRNSPAMNGRPMSPAGHPGRPMSPSGGPPRPMSPAGAPRAMSPAGGPRRPMSPAGPNGRMSPGPRGMGPPGRGPPRAMSPGAFNQAPRPLSPGPPGPRPQKRSQSPGPYGASGPMPMAGVQRRRSNSASALNVRDRRMSPPGPSKLGPGGTMHPMSPAIGNAL